ncbi:BatA domain-containing protein [Hymenobacter sp. BT635]|uniref:BatA domain-containing protein n=1 Tax=Hymenobacter nitidus TaxID=2880929 RepID=A0ABS8AFL5_9BACT|nr:BatA domain-containing protein [Hymenobacter nitidus]MCB2378651.1 BatA domain-containing protein [Hymenobacter nitidus]
MLTFLAPSGLLALLGVAVPIAIHLWNRRPGRTVQVGSIRWLAAAANRRMRNLKLEQLALLLLRALLLVVLAMAVAGPVWRQPPPPRRGQVLISADLLSSESLAAVRPSIDSLRRRGYTLRQLTAGFPRISDTTWQEASRQPAVANLLATQPFWARVSQAADSFPGQPVRVYSSATLRHFQGIRPALPANVTWQTVPLPAASAAWLTDASLAADSLKLILSQGTEENVLTSSRTVAKPRSASASLPRLAGLPPLRYEQLADGTMSIQTLAADSPRVAVRTQPLRLWLYHDADHALDARYLQAALRAAALGMATRLELTVSTSPPPTGQRLDWLCWLANASVPAAWQTRVRQGLTLWQDGRRPGLAVATTFGVAPHEARYAVSRLDTLLGTMETVVWQTGQGHAVLSRQALGQGVSYRFHSRLHPAWSTLADSPDLPLLWLGLLQPATDPRPDRHDPRQLDPAQIVSRQPGTAPVAAPLPAAPTDLDLRVWLVLAAALLWAMERLLAGHISSAKAVAV